MTTNQPIPAAMISPDSSREAPPSRPALAERFGGRHWRVWLVLVLLPMCLVWCTLRGLWRPDEPREAGISAQMASPGASLSVPYLGEEPFCEKPPGYYWLTSLGIRLFGQHPGAVRLPNLLLLLAGAWLVGELAFSLSGGRRLAGFVAGAFLVTGQLGFTVGIWILTDTLLMFASAGALLGLYCGLQATSWKPRLGWYSLMHTSLAIGFFAKNLVIWMVPVLAGAGYLLLTRRWRVLLRWELYAGLLIQAVLIAPWLVAVAARPDAGRILTIFFHDNLLGRFLSTQGAYVTYGSHRGPPWEYALGVLYYFLPWSPLLWPVVVQAWKKRTEPNWAFLISATVLPTILLSMAACKRSIYYAPVGIAWVSALALALLAEPGARATRRAAAFAAAIGWIMAFALPVASAAMLLVIAVPTPQLLLSLLGLAVGLPLLLILWRKRPRENADGTTRVLHAILAMALGFGPLSIGLVETVSVISDLGPACRRLAAEPGPVALFRPDEILLGSMPFQTGLILPAIPDEEALAARIAEEPGLRVMVESTHRRNKAWRVVILHDRFAAEEVWAEPSPGLRPPWGKRLSSIPLKATRHLGEPLGRNYSLFSFPNGVHTNSSLRVGSGLRTTDSTY